MASWRIAGRVDKYKEFQPLASLEIGQLVEIWQRGDRGNEQAEAEFTLFNRLLRVAVVSSPPHQLLQE